VPRLAKRSRSFLLLWRVSEKEGAARDEEDERNQSCETDGNQRVPKHFTVFLHTLEQCTVVDGDSRHVFRDYEEGSNKIAIMLKNRGFVHQQQRNLAHCHRRDDACTRKGYGAAATAETQEPRVRSEYSGTVIILATTRPARIFWVGHHQ